MKNLHERAVEAASRFLERKGYEVLDRNWSCEGVAGRLDLVAMDEGVIVFNGPDEQYVSGLAMGACAGIGGAYAVMPELFLKVYDCFRKGEMETARQIQNEICRIIYKMCSAHGNLYAVMKAILDQNGVHCGSVRKPLPALAGSDAAVVDEAAAMIAAAVKTYC